MPLTRKTKQMISRVTLATGSVLMLASLSPLFVGSLSLSADQKQVYGEWIEVGVPPYQTDHLILSANGVYRNHRLVSTQFRFDGNKIAITTGNGTTIYRLIGGEEVPQLKRLQPESPVQVLVKKGYEHKVTTTPGGASQRREALSDHFGQSK